MARALGIDFGGTKILAGVIDTDTGEVISRAKKRTRARGQANVMDRVLEVARDAIDGANISPHDLRAAGVGVAGQVDAQSGALVRAPNLPDELLGTGIEQQIQRALNVPVRIFNDVQAAAAGEAAFGAGRGYPDFVCVFVGTGIGGAIYRNGEPYYGSSNTAGELGHMVIDFGGRICGCGGKGHLEAYASRTAVVRSILAAMHQGRSSSLQKLAPVPDPDAAVTSDIRSRALSEAVMAGDPLALEMVQEGARYLGAGLVSIINFYNPPRIIIGGGMIDAVDLYFNLAVAHATQQDLQVPRQMVQIVKAGLGDFSGIVGSAVAAAKQLEPALAR